MERRIERPGRRAAAAGAGVHRDDRRAWQPGRQILQQADAPPGGIEAAGLVEGRLPDGPRGHRPAIDRRQAAPRTRDAASSETRSAPGGAGGQATRGDIRAGLDRQARAAGGGERPQRLDTERGPRLERRRRRRRVRARIASPITAAAPRGASRAVTRLDHLGAGTGVGDARGQRVPDRRVRPDRAGEDEGDRHARPTRRRSPLREAVGGRALDLPQHAFEARRLGGHRVQRGAHARAMGVDVGQLPVLPLRLEPRLDPLVGAVRLEQRERRRDHRRIERRPGAMGGARHRAVGRLDERQHRIVRRPRRHHELAIARRLAIGVEPRLVEGAVEARSGRACCRPSPAARACRSSSAPTSRRCRSRTRGRASRRPRRRRRSRRDRASRARGAPAAGPARSRRRRG